MRTSFSLVIGVAAMLATLRALSCHQSPGVFAGPGEAPRPSVSPQGGGFLEHATSTRIAPILTPRDVQAFLPATRGTFVFPAPYATDGIRLTVPADCGGADCVFPVGYAYWRNINNHVGSDTMLVFLGLNQSRGGSGPTLFAYNKVTRDVRNLGPLFDPGSPYAWHSGEGWYFSATKPTTLYLNDGPRLLRYDVTTRQLQTVFDVRPRFGDDKYIWQMHSSNDDRVHSATLRVTGTWGTLGCLAYREDTQQFFLFSQQKGLFYDECQIDKSGRWLLIKEKLGTDPTSEVDNRIIDLQTNTERHLFDRNGAAGHSDNGYGYMVADDNWARQPGTLRLWKFDEDLVPSPQQGTVVFHRTDFTGGIGHISHANARPGVPPDQQYACGGTSSRAAAPHMNEVLCFRLDGSLNVLVVAPLMTDLNAPGGGDDYAKLPKGNLDVTGSYFIWTSNLAGPRLDAFIVKVPAPMLTGGSAARQ